ncbi:MAG: hypothetical protein PWQ59_91 [Thermoanaerobacterium sp.]|jgi:hypothetical protein|uniref:L,D-transpeptidase family protein n=1 Tax=Thermoanaerobacterium TaxID=28895 RepID=UPI0024AA4A67|nr:L,D-transpeptidase [Thermoanaerobacterium sp. CMT5567-10]MDI3476566.1 hypothetical protein [Thermoanaerobacterium sp.]MDK2829948.1 hypothetical protein [Clostridium butyricum]MDN5317199.1 hypothetical protein [Thermoanaerobacterium sp.]WKV09709.1 L,D-transpeptidase [Thermoanaerobacterium sp. CMT5567-10]
MSIPRDYTIYANFYTNRDYKGNLTLRDSNGFIVFGPVECLGRGTSDANNNYDHANWMLIDADTPTGTYYTSIGSILSPLSSYGPNPIIELDPVGGNALLAANNGRSGFLIHGGDPDTNANDIWYPLRPTYGCIRLSNNNQQALIAKIKSISIEGLGILYVNNSL